MLGCGCLGIGGLLLVGLSSSLFVLFFLPGIEPILAPGTPFPNIFPLHGLLTKPLAARLFADLTHGLSIN